MPFGLRRRLRRLEAFAPILKRLRDRAKFILTHLVADEDHGERILELGEDADQTMAHYLYSGAEKASHFWIEMHRLVLA